MLLPLRQVTVKWPSNGIQVSDIMGQNERVNELLYAGQVSSHTYSLLQMLTPALIRLNSSRRLTVPTKSSTTLI